MKPWHVALIVIALVAAAWWHGRWYGHREVGSGVVDLQAMVATWVTSPLAESRQMICGTPVACPTRPPALGVPMPMPMGRPLPGFGRTFATRVPDGTAGEWR